jgi:predicted nucleic acid-binding protein
MELTLATWTELLIWPDTIDGSVVERSLDVYPVFGTVLTIIAILLLMLFGVYISRGWGVHLSGRKRAILSILRVAMVACLIPALLDLSLQLKLTRKVTPELVVAVDTSQSMTIADRYPNADQQPLLKSMLGHQASTAPAESVAAIERINIVKHLLTSSETGTSALDRLKQETSLRLYSFDQSLLTADTQTSDWVNNLQADGVYTDLASNVGELVNRLRSQQQAGMILFSDGAHNTGPAPLAAAEQWRDTGVNIHAVSVGDPNPKDIEVQQVLANRLLFKGDQAGVTVRLRHRGYEGQRVSLRLRSATTELARKDVDLPSNRADTNVTIEFTPTEAGEQTFQVECLPLPEEIVHANNSKTFVARVTTEKIRVLCIESTPRWQYRFLRDAMNRDRRLKLDIVLTGAEPVSEPPPPRIAAIPDDQDSIEAYDLIIIGDVDPSLFTDQQIEWMAGAVRDNGSGLLILAGPKYNPNRYIDSSLLDLFPVEPAPLRSLETGRPKAKESERFQCQLTMLGESHRALQLEDEAENNLRRWTSLPGVFWFAPVHKARSGSSVLAVHPAVPTEADPEQLTPLLAVQYFGKGRVFYCGIDETWRWRLRQGDRNFYRLWGQVIQYLGAPHLEEDPESITLRTDRASYGQGETALVTVRAEEIAGTEVPVLVDETEDGQQRKLPMNPAPGAEHVYEARLPLTTGGLHRLWIDQHPLSASAIIQVEQPQLEQSTPAANVSLLEQIADMTGGRFATAEEFDRLLNEIDLSPRTLTDVKTTSIWDSPLLVMLFVGLLGSEWILRRLWQLP